MIKYYFISGKKGQLYVKCKKNDAVLNIHIGNCSLYWQWFTVPLCGVSLEFANLVKKKKCIKRVCETACSWNGPDDKVIKPQLGGFVLYYTGSWWSSDTSTCLVWFTYRETNRKQCVADWKLAPTWRRYHLDSRLKLHVCFLQYWRASVVTCCFRE